MKKSTKINGIVCPRCEDIIYSLHRHHMHSCSCRLIFIDGGFDYVRCGFNITDKNYSIKDINSVSFFVNKTREELVKEYLNTSIKDKNIGVISKKDRHSIFDLLYLQ